MSRVLVLVLAWALIAVGCGGSADDDSAADGELPFDAVLIELFGTADVDAYRAGAQQQANALLIACMNDAGFEFSVPPPLPGEPTQSELASRAYAEQQGFSIIANFREWVAVNDLESTQSDPNARYLETLSALEVQQFLVALDGLPAEPGQLQEHTGCRGSATDTGFAEWDRFYDALPSYTALAEERDSHPDWLAARADWRGCMTERGYDYAEPDAIIVDVRDRMRDAVSEVYPDGRVPVIYDEEGRFSIDPEVEPLLDELEGFEIAAAVANIDCTEPLADQFEAVEREVQQAYVDRHRDTIDDLLAG